MGFKCFVYFLQHGLLWKYYFKGLKLINLINIFVNNHGLLLPWFWPVFCGFLFTYHLGAGAISISLIPYIMHQCAPNQKNHRTTGTLAWDSNIELENLQHFMVQIKRSLEWLWPCDDFPLCPSHLFLEWFWNGTIDHSCTHSFIQHLISGSTQGARQMEV